MKRTLAPCETLSRAEQVSALLSRELDIINHPRWVSPPRPPVSVLPQRAFGDRRDQDLKSNNAHTTTCRVYHDADNRGEQTLFTLKSPVGAGAPTRCPAASKQV